MLRIAQTRHQYPCVAAVMRKLAVGVVALTLQNAASHAKQTKHEMFNHNLAMIQSHPTVAVLTWR
jgi:hypothetical protein